MIIAPSCLRALCSAGLATAILLSACPASAQVTAADHAALAAGRIPASAIGEIETRIAARPARFNELLAATLADAAADPLLLLRVDKTQGLAEDFVPADLLPLDGSGIRVSRSGHKLRAPARAALLAMVRAARAEGVDLVLGSAYRSYAYQQQVFSREVDLYGRVQAERESAHPGSSQHQLGTAMDFSPIDDAFAKTRESRWLELHARAFGFSLSYPREYESVTGYKWESWHYRYIGKSAAALEGEFFGGVQQYLLEFIEAYRARKD